MNVACNQYGTPRWQAAHAKRISESEAPVVAGKPQTVAWRSIVEQLALDYAGVDRDPDEELRRLGFRTRFLPDVRAAVARYAKLRRAYTGEADCLPGMFSHDEHSWLVASPHALVPGGLACVCPHRTRAAWTAQERRGVGTALFARLQVQMFVCGRSWADVINYWSSGGDWRFDGWNRCRVEFDAAWIRDRFLPACVWLFGEVRKRRAALVGEPVT